MKSVEEKGKLRQRWHNQTPRSRKDIWRIVMTLLGAVISLAVVAYLVEGLDWQTMHRTFVNLDWTWLLMAWLIFTLNYILRTIRFRILLSKKVSFLSLFPIASLHGMLNYLLPSKSGEISFPLLLKRYRQVPMKESTAVLLTARVFDFLSISFFLSIVLIVYWTHLPTSMIYASLIFCGLVFSLSGTFFWLLQRQQRGASTKIESLPLAKSLNRLINVWMDLVGELRAIYKRKQILSVSLLTVGIWLCVYTNLYLILLSLGHRLNYFQVIVISLVTVPISLLPIRGFANLGTHEASWIPAFMLFGETDQSALAIAVSSHAILLVFILLLGLSSIIVLVLDLWHRGWSTKSLE